MSLLRNRSVMYSTLGLLAAGAVTASVILSNPTNNDEERTTSITRDSTFWKEAEQSQRKLDFQALNVAKKSGILA